MLSVMELDHDLYYAACESRDARFDGRFFVGVVTTGIYCRPVCPVPMPKRKNVRFYPSAAAARDAGFRPCLRCRPEASPGTPDWQGPSALVARGMQLIEEGVIEDGGVEALAQRLNLSVRQLRRLFAAHLGTTPIRVAQTRRLHFAKKLISETELPMTEVAFAAGYGSIRRFNDVIRTTYERTPTDLRRRKKKAASNGHGGHIRLTLAYRPPFDWPALLDFLAARAIPGVEQIAGNRYRRTVQIEKESGLISIEVVEGQDHLLLNVPPNLSAHLLLISERVRDLFDLGADPMAIAQRFEHDPLLRPLVHKHPGLRIPGALSVFEIGVRAILGQQVSVKAANTLAGRIVQAYGTPLTDLDDNGLTHLFPRPEQLAKADLLSIGLTSKRAETVLKFARATIEKRIPLQKLASLDEAIEALTSIPGIGPWTAHYIAMRGLGEPDAFPAGDLALQRATAHRRTERLTESELLARSQGWRPWRAYAAIHLWKQYAIAKNGAITK